MAYLIVLFTDIDFKENNPSRAYETVKVLNKKLQRLNYKKGVLVIMYVKPMSKEESLKVNEELIYSTPEKPVKN